MLECDSDSTKGVSGDNLPKKRNIDKNDENKKGDTVVPVEGNLNQKESTMNVNHPISSSAVTKDSDGDLAEKLQVAEIGAQDGEIGGGFNLTANILCEENLAEEDMMDKDSCNEKDDDNTFVDHNSEEEDKRRCNRLRVKEDKTVMELATTRKEAQNAFVNKGVSLGCSIDQANHNLDLVKSLEQARLDLYLSVNNNTINDHVLDTGGTDMEDLNIDIMNVTESDDNDVDDEAIGDVVSQKSRWKRKEAWYWGCDYSSKWQRRSLIEGLAGVLVGIDCVFKAGPDVDLVSFALWRDEMRKCITSKYELSNPHSNKAM
ncbi:hypothetical protein GUJ93_ZPchr0013g36098 [Zizania palustris]|uniref:Uncharacterized protein n=1 Tax=Zizania palustris TaxID=103762 RepID=A0A8J5WW08_ZIZPA|nr:hypothetical protein GUJ93_ZPchr0013g36098 [Zizania palustris]